ncbi:hypothetical protein [Maritalea mediterranea]|uniref:Uncharacterized protein n=1 Tax=Maritalea mediterranea TaxID=2909667 RepID=A0ABS9E7B6_9HYPH|nr:hypothetical protein [Maritalea mediterranea]MCF4098732.1 hypothetical protein [Maritalea mediterranea]
MNSLFLMALLSIVGLGIIYGLEALEPEKTEIDPDFVGEKQQVALGFGEVFVPNNWLVAPMGEGQHAVETLQLLIPIQLETKVVEVPVDLVPASRTTPSAYLLDALYIHRFASEPARYENGLVGRKLKDGEGYQNESVWYDPLRPQPFVAKCVEPVDESVEVPNCLETKLVTRRVAAMIKFPAQYLPQWKMFDAQMRAKLNLMTKPD